MLCVEHQCLGTVHLVAQQPHVPPGQILHEDRNSVSSEIKVAPQLPVGTPVILHDSVPTSKE